MKVRCWGARGSIPVSGPDFDIHGGDTCCIEVTAGDGSTIIIDAGTGARRLGIKLLETGVSDFSLLFTHAHWDHINGFPFFRPIFHRTTRMTIYGSPLENLPMKDILASTMAAPYFPIPLEQIEADITYRDVPVTPNHRFDIGPVAVRSIPLNHPNGGTGYRFTEGERSFVFLTDNELGNTYESGLGWEDFLEFARGADLLVHDAEYTVEEYPRKRGWGHSHYRAALDLALEAGVATFCLFHHNQDRTDEELRRIVDDCRRVADGRLRCLAMTQETEILL